MIGIGLGGFMDGFQQGQKIRDDKEDRERKKVLTERQDAEYDRAKVQRDQIDQINADARTTFDSKVQAGEAKPDEFDNFYNKYVIPKLKNTYLGQGDLEKADAVQKWGDTAEAKQGARLFRSALMKSQTGDGAGALADVMEMGKISGYLDHGYEVLGQENIMVDGKLTGYRLNMKTPDGKDLVQDIAPADLPKLISTFANPEAAWASQLEARAAASKREQDMADYRTKKGIDKEFSTGDSKVRSDAVKSLRKSMDGGLDGSGEKFDDLPDDKKEELIAKEIELVTGQPGIAGEASSRPDPKPARKVVMDRATGQVVEVKSGASGARSEEPAGDSRPPEGPRPGSENGPTLKERKAQVLSQAGMALEKGEDPRAVAAQLAKYGIPEREWPPALLRQYGSPRGQIGLGQ